jgi:hypothetical protein
VSHPREARSAPSCRLRVGARERAVSLTRTFVPCLSGQCSREAMSPTWPAYQRHRPAVVRPVLCSGFPSGCVHSGRCRCLHPDRQPGE